MIATFRDLRTAGSASGCLSVVQKMTSAIMPRRASNDNPHGGSVRRRLWTSCPSI